VSIALVIAWLVVAKGVAVYLGGRGFTHPLLGGLLWPLTACAFVLAAREQPGSRLRIVLGFESGLTPVELSPDGSEAATEGPRYGQIETAGDDR
jgi:hypothetical protein